MGSRLAMATALAVLTLGVAGVAILAAAHLLAHHGTQSTIAPQAPERSDHMEDLTTYERSVFL